MAELITENTQGDSVRTLGAYSFWSWNSEMDDESIIERILEFKEQGLSGFFMHPRGGLLTEYLSKDWFRAIRTAVKTAEKQGMTAWIYDEDGWPSGFAGGLVSNLGQEYQSKFFQHTADKSKIHQSSHVFAVFEKTTEGYHRTEEDTGDLYFYYSVEPNYVDLLSKKVTAKFIETTHEVYKRELGEYFGTTILGFFTDEPQYNASGYPFSFELADYFFKRNQYDFLDNLYLLTEDDTIASVKFRQDYWETVEEMMRFHFSKQIFDWCEENGVAFTGHYPGEDSLIQQLMCTAGVMPKYEFTHLPGIDYLGRRITSPLLTKQVMSTAKQFGHKQVLSETFSCTGWNVTFDELAYMWGWQAVAGINMPCFCLGAHSIKGIRKRDYPAAFSYQASWWNEFHHVSDWMQNINNKMAVGRWIEDVLVLNPIGGVMLTYKKDNSATEKIGASYRKLLESLLDAQVGFDIGDEVLLERHGRVVGKTIELGKCSYKLVVVPETSTLKASTWDMLKEFQQGGGEVVFTSSVPALAEAGTQSVPMVEGIVVQNRLGFWNKYFEHIGFKRPLSVLTSNGFSVAEGLHVGIKEDGEKLYAYIWNHQVDAVRELIFHVPGHKKIVTTDISTGLRTQLETWQSKDATYAKFTITKSQSVFFEAEDGAPYTAERKNTATSDLEGIISLTDDNTLVIDYAQYSLDGIEYSEPLQIVKLHPALYQELGNQSDVTVYIKYTFYNHLSKPVELQVGVEDTHCVDVFCNGISVLSEKKGWFIDKGIPCYDIAHAVTESSNVIDVTYHLPSSQVENVDGLHETEVNRFFYPVEPEAVYIRGDFDVEQVGTFWKNPTFLALEDPTFSLVDATTKTDIQDLTPQGLWFYRGNAEVHTSVIYSSGEQVFIALKGLRAALVKIKCNKKEKVIFLEPHTVEITDLLQEGENAVVVELFGTNRNVLGPHHHIKGENNFVGPSIFKGEFGYEDTIVNPDLHHGQSTWTDNYSFVSFGCERMKLIIKK